MVQYNSLAAVDLGSNSFHLQVVRVDDGQLYELDSIKEPVRLAAGLDDEKRLTEPAQERALACLERFGERLRGFPATSVRAVATNTLRVARNARQFLAAAEKVLGFPIDIIAGREEARLIYLGVAHGLPATSGNRLVVDIGGGSTECIIGNGIDPIHTESLYVGCVGLSQRFFADGKVTASRMLKAEVAARSELQTITTEFTEAGWTDAVASSGTARTLAEMIVQAGLGEREITPGGLDGLRAMLIKAGDWRQLELPGLPPDRAPVIAGGLAIMSAVLSELGVDRMSLSPYALRHGVLFDLIGRVEHHDMREATVQQFQRRYQIDMAQARRVEASAVMLFEQVADDLPGDARERGLQRLTWAAGLHEIGISIAYNNYHKHSSYIAKNADMPGFSKSDQATLSALLLAHRGSLTKASSLLIDELDWSLVAAIRVAAALNRRRASRPQPPVSMRRIGDGFALRVEETWLRAHPLSNAALENEAAYWRAIGRQFAIEFG